MFQFHIGSIKSERRHTLSDPGSEFQFHIGSIKSRAAADVALGG